ncbi:hypothetical protein RJT34_05156 [Clitoria ternatea]|uniref:Uncharacterized protein n=1 Tax=Clitoria ternatea TaxID=43366 RepID=A0AAN9K2N2_CLITE
MDVKEENNTTGPNWVELPIEITAKILNKLEFIDVLMGARLVCSFIIQLCRLGIPRCSKVTDEGLSGVVSRLSFLEELDLSFCSLSNVSLEAIGLSCSFLKVLKFNKTMCNEHNGDEEAFAIAKTLPNLCRLELLGIRLTNDGLVAILDGCSQLEYLDLRGCRNLDLHASLWNRCVEQIKYIKRRIDLLGFMGYLFGVLELPENLVTSFDPWRRDPDRRHEISVLNHLDLDDHFPQLNL